MLQARARSYPSPLPPCSLRHTCRYNYQKLQALKPVASNVAKPVNLQSPTPEREPLLNGNGGKN